MEISVVKDESDRIGIIFLFFLKPRNVSACQFVGSFFQLDDPRRPRGIRHPFSRIVSLTLLGMLSRIREMEVLVR